MYMALCEYKLQINKCQFNLLINLANKYSNNNGTIIQLRKLQSIYQINQKNPMESVSHGKDCINIYISTKYYQLHLFVAINIKRQFVNTITKVVIILEVIFHMHTNY